MRLKKQLIETKSNFLDLSKSDLDKDILEETKEQPKSIDLVTAELESLRSDYNELEERET